MTPDMLTRVFDLFVQGERTLDRAEGGLGIGLTLVRRLVEMHGGAVEAGSPGPGRAATFTVRLPAVAAARGGRRGAAPAPAASRERRRVLIVEDNADAREMLALPARAWRATRCTRRPTGRPGSRPSWRCGRTSR